jgi:hypothetical protein
MICPMAIIQMKTSKKPRIGAITLFPLETKIMRMVPRDTSITRAMRINNGNIK